MLEWLSVSVLWASVTAGGQARPGIGSAAVASECRGESCLPRVTKLVAIQVLDEGGGAIGQATVSTQTHRRPGTAGMVLKSDWAGLAAFSLRVDDVCDVLISAPGFVPYVARAVGGQSDRVEVVVVRLRLDSTQLKGILELPSAR